MNSLVLLLLIALCDLFESLLKQKLSQNFADNKQKQWESNSNCHWYHMPINGAKNSLNLPLAEVTFIGPERERSGGDDRVPKVIMNTYFHLIPSLIALVSPIDFDGTKICSSVVITFDPFLVSMF